MSRETRLFLLITPPAKPFGRIEVACTVVGNTETNYGICAEFSRVDELESRLASAGLPHQEIRRAVERLGMNYPTFHEISHAIAENMSLIDTSDDVRNDSPDAGLFDSAGLLPAGCIPNAIASPSATPTF